MTTIPGPARSLWFAGAQLVRTFPVAQLVPLVGLSVAALSYADQLTVALNADGALRDPDILGDGIGTLSYDDLGVLAM